MRRLSSPEVATGFDPEAEQEVDFARYGRMLARRWWLVAVGVVVGVVIGFLTSLGGTKVYEATATLYLGQPYNPSATIAVITLQTNPSAVATFANAQAIDVKVAKVCGTKVGAFRKGISIQKIATTSTPTKATALVNPLVGLSVQAAKGKVATCAANALAREVVADIGTYPQSKIANYEQRVAADTTTISGLNAAIANPSTSGAILGTLYTRLATAQTDYSTYSQLLLFAKQVELPRVTIDARERQVSAQSSHNTVIIAALIGLILGILGALLWDRVVPRLTARNGS